MATALAAVRARRSLDEIDGRLPAAGTAHLRSGAEMAAAFARCPGAVPNAARLGEELAFDLRLVAPRLPDVPVPAGHTDATWLRHLAMEGARARYGPRSDERVSGAYISWSTSWSFEAADPLTVGQTSDVLLQH